MRATLGLVLALCLAGPAHADIDDDFAAANRIFGQVSAERLTEDIAGEWLPLSTLANLKGADPLPGLIKSYLARLCGNDPLRGALIRQIGEASFEMVEAASSGALTYRFDWIGGTQFHRSFDPQALFKRHRVDATEGEKGTTQRARLLEAMPSRVDLHRPSPDLLVISTPQRVEIFGRCPKG